MNNAVKTNKKYMVHEAVKVHGFPLINLFTYTCNIPIPRIKLDVKYFDNK